MAAAFGFLLKNLSIYLVVYNELLKDIQGKYSNRIISGFNHVICSKLETSNK